MLVVVFVLCVRVGVCACAVCSCQYRCECLSRCACVVSVSVRVLVFVVVVVPCVRVHAGADDPLIPGVSFSSSWSSHFGHWLDPLIPGGLVGSAGKAFICTFGRIASIGLRKG